MFNSAKNEDSNQIKNPMYESIRKKGPAFKNGKLKEKYVGGPGKHSKVSNYNSSPIFSFLVTDPRLSGQSGLL